MMIRRVLSPSLILVILVVAVPARVFDLEARNRFTPPIGGIGPQSEFASLDPSFYPEPVGDIKPFEDSDVDYAGHVVKTPTDGGIMVDVPDKYKDKFEAWKAELLSTDFGRQQWDQYANNKNFILTINISNKKGKGAGTDKYLWDDSGKLVGATITLGEEIEKGYPDPIYYPVMNSLSSDNTTYTISGKILAATKLSHEIGHVNQTAKANRNVLLVQSKLMPEYTSIFLSNGRDPNDKKLVEMAKQMGGTPVEIWESREYWSEVNAMLYLKERISKEDFYCFVFNKIKRNLDEYAKDYEQRFDRYSKFTGSPCWK